jgi:hypothetical protein
VNRKGRQRIQILLDGYGLAQEMHEVNRPRHYTHPLPGLPVLPAWLCKQGNSSHLYITTNQGSMKKHCRKEHGVKIGRGRRSQEQRDREQHSVGYSRVQVQTLFKKTALIDYYIVRIPDIEEGEQASQQLLSEAQCVRPSQPRTWDTGAAAELKRGYDEAQNEHLKRYEAVEGVKHVSELMAWLRSTRFQAHLENVDVKEIPASYQVPGGGEASTLRALCDSVARVLRSGMAALDYDDAEESGPISRPDLKLINTFERNRLSQDPIKPLQNRKSRQNYIDTFQKLICYIWNVSEGVCLAKKKMFAMTATQEKKWVDSVDTSQH